jgi:hypothetical protein
MKKYPDKIIQVIDTKNGIIGLSERGFLYRIENGHWEKYILEDISYTREDVWKVK